MGLGKASSCLTFDAIVACTLLVQQKFLKMRAKDLWVMEVFQTALSLTWLHLRLGSIYKIPYQCLGKALMPQFWHS